jgi:hypothetical protein
MKKFVAIVGSAVLVAGTAFAGDMDNEKTFNELDQNQDGVLTQAEVSTDQALLARFDAADADRDGKLTSSEFDSINDEAEESE